MRYVTAIALQSTEMSDPGASDRAPIAVTVRLAPEVIEALDREAERQNRAGRHPKANRASLIRELVEHAARDW